MDTKDEEFLKRLLATFQVEAREHLSAITSGLIELEKAGPGQQAGIIETVFRESHSLKGAARSVNLPDVVAVCQSMENVFSSLKKKEVSASSQMLDLLHQAADRAGALIGGEGPADEKPDIRGLLVQLDNAAKGRKETAKQPGESEEKLRADAPRKEEQREQEKSGITEIQSGEEEASPVHRPTPSPVSSSSETVRISSAKLNSLLLQAEELLSVKLATGQRAAELREIKRLLDLRRNEKDGTGMHAGGAVKTGTWKIKNQDSTVDSRDLHGPSPDPIIASLESRLTALLKAAEYDYRSVGMMVDSLLDDMKKALMLPFSSLLEIFPKFVRDLSHDSGKMVEFSVEGGEIEIDRRILEEIKDPLIHLVRNCIDHGIETPEERTIKKKPERGAIKVAAVSRDNKLEIVVSDDGAGLDVSKIRASAVRHGHITQEEAERLGDRDARLLIFRSGVTTSPIITDLSGRGLGLAIVREKVEKLNGTIAIDTRPDAGTMFTMVVPITLATFRGVLVTASGQLFVLPSVNVERMVRMKAEEVMTVENRETLSFNGQVLPFCRLADALELKTAAVKQQPALSASASDSLLQIAVLGSAEKRVAFLVEDVLMEQEVLTKPLGRQLSRVRNVAGATVLGSGRVVPILNIPDLLKSAVSITAAPVRRADEELLENEKSVLVVEDSITARTLLKNILESAGYGVMTAVDGVDALTALRTRPFDLVVSDVDMPRMNGFALTAKIRGDKKFSGLPVVLVTALESREDRERGVDAGANAYIIKSSFDQSNLLEVVKRLI